MPHLCQPLSPIAQHHSLLPQGDDKKVEAPSFEAGAFESLETDFQEVRSAAFDAARPLASATLGPAQPTLTDHLLRMHTGAARARWRQEFGTVPQRIRQTAPRTQEVA